MSFSRHQRSRSRHIGRACFDTLEDRRLLSFSPATSFPVSANPQDLVTADFNNDGKLDLATSSFDDAGDGSVSVLLGNGNGNGAFQPARTFATGPYTFSLAAGDFNGDGKMDLATANQDVFSETGDNDVSILIGNGDGTFAAAVPLSASSAYSWAITTGDMNGDGKLDLVVTSDDSFGGDTVSVLLGHGDGSFAAPINLDTIYGTLYSATLADFNSDGKLDLAAAGWNMYGPIVFLGNGDGTLQDPVFLDNDTGAGSNSLTAADFNADGKIDLVTTNYMSNSASVFLGNGAGGFTLPRTFSAGKAPGSAAAADVNADGKLDLLVTNGSLGGAVSVLLGKGDGAGGLAAPITVATGGSYPSAVVVADFSGDGRPDAAAANNGSSSVAILLNDGNWTVPPPRISISDVSKAEGKNKSSTSFTFTVSLSSAFDQYVTVSYRTVNGTATAGNGGDYTSKTGTITFAPGQTTKTITIEVKGDNKRESNETFFVDLFNLSGNASFTKSRGVGTILDDD